MPENGRKPLPNSATCFVCGENNAAGLGARFYAENDTVIARWRPAPHHCGYADTVHGGVVAAILDESMAWAATRALRRMCVTGELTVRYFQRTPGDRELEVHARVAEAGRRRVVATAVLRDAAGMEYADARGKFVPLGETETLAVDDALIYRGDEERVFDELRSQVRDVRQKTCP